MVITWFLSSMKSSHRPPSLWTGYSDRRRACRSLILREVDVSVLVPARRWILPNSGIARDVHGTREGWASDENTQRAGQRPSRERPVSLRLKSSVWIAGIVCLEIICQVIGSLLGSPAPPRRLRLSTDRPGAPGCTHGSWPHRTGMSQARFLILLVALSMNFQRASFVILENTLEKWQRYSDACFRNMSRDSQPKGVVCNRTFDRYACWPDGLPNTTVNVSCPWYLPWYPAVQGGFVFRKCGPDGQWVMDSVKQPWRDSSQCMKDPKDDRAEQEQGRILDGFLVMKTVGLSLSLGTLVLALGILVGFRKLHCMRNYIHMNLFASFILRAVSILIKDALFKTQNNQIPEGVDIKVWYNNETAVGCRTAQVLMQYCVGANYYWLLIEGIYLHNLLVITVFSERNYFNIYLCIGWGSPLLFVVPWVVIKYLYENTGCWTTNENMAYWWIIRTPILFSILINFFIFIRIIHILVSKLRAHQMRYTDYKFRLAKSTLTLIPLLGIHEVAFAFVTDEHAQGMLRHVKLFFDLFLHSFQGILVAILYCFVNREVQSELLKWWKRWKLGKDLEEEYRHTYSQPAQARNGSGSLEKQQLVGGWPNGVAESGPRGPPFPAGAEHKALCLMESNC